MKRKNLSRTLMLGLIVVWLFVVTSKLYGEDDGARPDVEPDSASSLQTTYQVNLPTVATSNLSAGSVPGADVGSVGLSEVTFGSILPVVTESGFISLSVDGVGTVSSSGIIQVEKPAGATVRSAYMAAASRGFSGHRIGSGQISIAGSGVAWDIETPSSITSFNYWADVTPIVKPLVDAAPPGRINLTVGEVNTTLVDGELMAVIFDDPNQTTENTAVLLFGAQDVTGDTFNVAFAEPIDTGNPNLVLDMSLGISYSFQANQFSIVNVNGTRMSSSAGGQDDGILANGGLLTVGGLDDSNANPPPFAPPAGNPRTDDELYSLIPFVTDGDTTITVFTRNPSQDDNIFFSSLFLTGEAVVGEGILLSPDGVTNPVGESHTITARVQDDNGNPVVGRLVTFDIVSGPNAGLTGTGSTNSSGETTFTYSSTLPGTDVIEASFVDSKGTTQTSNQVTKIWEVVNQPPAVDADNEAVVVDEGQTATNIGTVSDPDGDPVTLTASAGTVTNNNDGTWSWSFATTDGPAESQTVTVTADDGAGATAQTSFTLTVNNVAPTVAPPTVPTEAVSIDDLPLSLTATFSDPAGRADEPFTCTVDYGDGSMPQIGTVTGTICIGPDYAYAEPGTYLITIAVTDKDGGIGTATASTFIVIYDREGGFITGGGWIWSDSGDCRLNPVCAGADSKATFGFVSKYKKGARRPMGNTEFQFHAGDINFHAKSYEWLVVAGGRAQYQGVGTINGLDTYRVRVTVFDAAADASDAVEADRFRIRIWSENDATGAETVVYDSGTGDDLDVAGGSGTDELGSGSINIHSHHSR